MRIWQFSMKLWKIFFSREFIVYFLFGGIATFVDWGLVYFLTSIFGIWYVFSVGGGYIGGLFSAYILHRKFTFRNQDTNIHKQFFVFWIITVAGLFLTWAMVISLVEFASLWYMHARIIVTGVMLFFNFFCHKYITFKK